MRWEIIDNSPKVGDVRFKTKFAFLPTKVLSKLTMTDHWIWLELYIEEQEYRNVSYLYDGPNGGGRSSFNEWVTVSKTIHV
jgi:hypothetical protein